VCERCAGVLLARPLPQQRVCPICDEAVLCAARLFDVC
jgi:hypothetical protein